MGEKKQKILELREHIKGLTNEEILREQLELLAEYSKTDGYNEELPELSRAMVDIFVVLN
jgi:hypothetical protein